MSFHLSPIGNDQQFDANGDPLNGGKIYTYLAGTTTPVATYTDDTGVTPQANPIILNSLGAPASPIWLTGGVAYKFVIKDVNDVTLRTIDDISGINDFTSNAADEWTLCGSAPTYTSATSFTLVGDQTLIFQVGRRLKSANTGGTIYSSILTSTYSAPNTTITVVNDSGSLDAGMSAVSYALLNATNPSVPYQYATGNSIQSQTYVAGTTAGSTTAYTLDLTPNIVFAARVKVSAKFHATNTTTTPTLSVDGNSAAIKIWQPDTTKRDPIVGELVIDSVYDFEYDGTNWCCSLRAPQLATATPQPAGTAAVGTSQRAAREDHVHAAPASLLNVIPQPVHSTAGSSATFTVAPGQAADYATQTLMTLAASISKTTSAWAVGSGNGSLDGGTIANNTWYYSYLIRRPDTDVEDVLTSLAPASAATVTMTIASPCVVTYTDHGLQANAPIVFTTTGALPTGVTAGTVYYVISTGLTASTFQFAATRGGAAINSSGTQSGTHTGTSNPELPANYTQYRRIGAMRTNGSAQWTRFFHDGLRWAWDVPTLDVNATAVASTAVSRTLTVPPSIRVLAYGQVYIENATAAAQSSVYISDLSGTDSASSTTAAPLAHATTPNSGTQSIGHFQCRSNGSGQVRTRCQAATDNLRIATYGWFDYRNEI